MPAMYKACGWWIRDFKGEVVKRDGMIVKCVLQRGHAGECQPPEVPHELRQDSTGTGLDRWSCYAKRPGCNGRAVVRQPYMTELEWAHAVAAFKELHIND